MRETHPQIVVRQAEHTVEQHHQTDHRDDDVAQERDGRGERTAAPLQRGDDFVEHEQREGQTDQQPERRPPRLLQARLQHAKLGHDSATGQSSTSPMSRTAALNEGPKATSSRTRSRTARVTWMEVLPSDSMPRASRTVSPHRS